MKIAVMGYGTIGSGVVDVLRINKEKITKRAGEPVDVKYILDLREFPGDPMEDAIVHDYQTIVNDPEIGIVVETMGGVEPAYTFVKAMLEAGKQVATSNKNLVAAKGAELIKIARMMICSRRSEVATITVYFRPFSWANFSMYWSAVSASFVKTT